MLNTCRLIELKLLSFIEAWIMNTASLVSFKTLGYNSWKDNVYYKPSCFWSGRKTASSGAVRRRNWKYSSNIGWYLLSQTRNEISTNVLLHIYTYALWFDPFYHGGSYDDFRLTWWEGIFRRKRDRRKYGDFFFFSLGKRSC